MNGQTARMRAAVIHRFGGPEELALGHVPVPAIGPRDVLVKVEFAGLGVWDSFEREGGYAELLGTPARFPYVLGSEGAGTVAAAGEAVTEFRVGDRVYGSCFLNPKGGCYAEYAALDAAYVRLIPGRLSAKEAAVVSGAGVTAIRGLEDVLQLAPGESIFIHGASGGIGHVAVQLAARMGARVFAVASGDDGVGLMKRLGVAAIDGRREDPAAAARAFAPDGFDAALLTAGGEAAERAAECVRAGGRIAFPNGIRPEPAHREGKRLTGYNGDPDPGIVRRLHKHLEAGLTVHVDRTFELEEVREAHAAMDRHYVGKLCLRIRGGSE